MLPWSCFFIKSIRGISGKNNRDDAHCYGLFLGIWAAVIITFFSFSSCKLATYILPALPPMALLTGSALSRLIDSGLQPYAKTVRSLQAIVICGAAASLLYPLCAHRPRFDLPAGMICSLLLLLEALLVSLAFRYRQAVALVLSLVVMTYAEEIILPPYIFNKLLHKRSVKELALIVKEKAKPEDRICSYGFYAPDMAFYTGRRIICVETPKELQFGSMQGDQSPWFMRYPDFYKLWDSQTRLFTLIDVDDLDGLRKAVHTPIRLRGRKGDRLIASNY